MGIIAWIVLGLGAGLLANMLIPGWAATELFHVHTADGTAVPARPAAPDPGYPVPARRRAPRSARVSQ